MNFLGRLRGTFRLRRRLLVTRFGVICVGRVVMIVVLGVRVRIVGHFSLLSSRLIQKILSILFCSTFRKLFFNVHTTFDLLQG